MELLEGLDADTLVRRYGPVAPERAVHLLLQACKSLEEAHARGLVHRDIKPANIFVCRHGLEYDFVKVLDFGLVKSLGSAEDSGATKTGIIAGTPESMAPEIARGDGRFDHRADVYSLGCVAYRLLSGRPVFDAKSPIELMIEHVRTIPRRPSARSGCGILPRSRTSSIIAFRRTRRTAAERARARAPPRGASMEKPALRARAGLGGVDPSRPRYQTRTRGPCRPAGAERSPSGTTVGPRDCRPRPSGKRVDVVGLQDRFRGRLLCDWEHIAVGAAVVVTHAERIGAAQTSGRVRA